MNTDDDPALRKLLAGLREICATLPGAQEYVMVHHPAFRVGRKPFAIAGLDGAGHVGALSINFGVDEQQLLLDDERFSRTPYIGQYGWVTIAQRDLQAGELESLVTDSWRRLASKKQLAEHDAAYRPAAASEVAQAPRLHKTSPVVEELAAPKRRAHSR